jgi:hypothetical protein
MRVRSPRHPPFVSPPRMVLPDAGQSKGAVGSGPSPGSHNVIGARRGSRYMRIRLPRHAAGRRGGTTPSVGAGLDSIAGSRPWLPANPNPPTRRGIAPASQIPQPW